MISGDLWKILGINWNWNLYNSVKSKQKSKSYGANFNLEKLLSAIQEQVKFLKLGIWFQFYHALNKDTFFDSPGISSYYCKTYVIGLV